VGYLCWVIKLVITISTVKGVVHFQIEISWSFTHPHVIQDVHVFLSSVEKKLRFLRKMFQDFRHIVTSMGSNGLKVQMYIIGLHSKNYSVK